MKRKKCSAKELLKLTMEITNTDLGMIIEPHTKKAKNALKVYYKSGKMLGVPFEDMAFETYKSENFVLSMLKKRILKVENEINIIIYRIVSTFDNGYFSGWKILGDSKYFVSSGSVYSVLDISSRYFGKYYIATRDGEYVLQGNNLEDLMKDLLCLAKKDKSLKKHINK